MNKKIHNFIENYNNKTTRTSEYRCEANLPQIEDRLEWSQEFLNRTMGFTDIDRIFITGLSYIEHDIDVALDLIKGVANLGYAPAILKLAQMYEKGESVEPNREIAEMWMNKFTS